MMILQMFGETHTANVIEEDQALLLLADARTVDLLSDACEIAEPVWVNDQPCRVRHIGEPWPVAIDSILEVVFEPLDGTC